METDLSEVDSERARQARGELGTEAFDAALRIRDRVVNSPPTGDRGRSTSVTASASSARCRSTRRFAQIRDFLAANPDEVLVIVIEDYVEPAEIADAAERTGLIDYVYTGALEPAVADAGRDDRARAGGC